MLESSQRLHICTEKADLRKSVMPVGPAVQLCITENTDNIKFSICL